MAPLLCGAISDTALEPPTPPLLPLIKPPKLIKNWAKQKSGIKKLKNSLFFALAVLVWFYFDPFVSAGVVGNSHYHYQKGIYITEFFSREKKNLNL